MSPGLAQGRDDLERAIKKGVPIAMGSDAVFTTFGKNTRELAHFVRAGMTPEQAIASATTVGARLLGKEAELGAIAAGYFADIVVVDGDPLADIGAVINGVRWVMKNGRVVYEAGKTTKIALQPNFLIEPHGDPRFVYDPVLEHAFH